MLHLFFKEEALLIYQEPIYFLFVVSRIFAMLPLYYTWRKGTAFKVPLLLSFALHRYFDGSLFFS